MNWERIATEASKLERRFQIRPALSFVLATLGELHAVLVSIARSLEGPGFKPWDKNGE